MSYWEHDPFGPERDYETPPTKGGRSELTQKAISSLIAAARNEGVEVCGGKRIEPCINTGSTQYHYDPRHPEIVVDITQPWPQARWFLAVALGHHFTRHHFYQLSDRAVWRQQAEQWAVTFLATHTAEHSRYYDLLPDNTVRGQKPKPVTKKPSKPPERARKRRTTCKANRRNGKPCRNYPTPGTAFCRHHQGQEAHLSTLADIVGGLTRGSHE